jgi:alkylation response protein AidB-like acyl-CoA dehydrogenase
MRLEEALCGEHEELRAAARRALEGDATRFGGLGWYGLAVPEEDGGAGLGHVEQCVIAEEIGRALAGVPFLGAAMASAALLEEGGEREWLPRIAAGELSAALVWDPGWTLDAELLVIGRRGFVGVPRAPIATLDETRRMASISI